MPEKNDILSYAETKQYVMAAIQSRDVTEHIKKTVGEAVHEIMEEFSRVPFIERQKTVRNAMFQNTEKLLYYYNALKSHLESEEEYMGMVLKNTSGSVVRFQKNSSSVVSDDQLLEDRRKSYLRSKNDYERVTRALSSVSGKKGFQIIEIRYLSDADVRPTWEEITDKLRGVDGFSSKLSEKTVRRYKNKLINEISVLLFGTDAI